MRKVRFFGMRKETGHLWDRLHDFVPFIADEVLKNFQDVFGVAAPRKPFVLKKHKDGTYRAPWQCQYCAYTETCQGNFEVQYKKDQFGNQKPTYIFKGGEDAIRSQSSDVDNDNISKDK